MQKFFGILAASLMMFIGAAQAREQEFPLNKWDTYDGGQRLLAMQQACQDDRWPKGYSPRQTVKILSTMSRAKAEQIVRPGKDECDPKGLGNTEDTRRAKPDTSPFRKGGYHCWVDGEGRHRVPLGDKRATGWCRGKAVGDPD